ncbi:MAG TPA: N-acetyltransferase [Clostridiales bacterium]|nr:N-acetyltransferase [Clostridiales bacterium]
MIRNFKENDIDVVMNIWLETNIAAHDFIESGYWRDNFDDVKKMIPEASVYAYEEQGEVQGFIGLVDGYIAGIFVRSEYQSKGIGRNLLNYAKSIRNNLSLQVYKKNEGAVRFYLKEDFSIAKEQIDESTGETEFVMSWTMKS